jgi:hypothetical protein
MTQMNAPKELGAGSLRFRRTLWRIFLSQRTLTEREYAAATPSLALRTGWRGLHPFLRILLPV